MARKARFPVTAQYAKLSCPTTNPTIIAYFPLLSVLHFFWYKPPSSVLPGCCHLQQPLWFGWIASPVRAHLQKPCNMVGERVLNFILQLQSGCFPPTTKTMPYAYSKRDTHGLYVFWSWPHASVVIRRRWRAS